MWPSSANNGIPPANAAKTYVRQLLSRSIFVCKPTTSWLLMITGGAPHQFSIQIKRSSMNLEIRFGNTRSARLTDAIRQAEQIPGFTKPEGAGAREMVVSTELPFDAPELWWKVECLLETVRCW